MLKIAVIEDDPDTSRQLQRWVGLACPGAQVDQWYTKADAERAINATSYDLIVLDIELKPERNAGVELINKATRTSSVPVLVVSGMPADIYRGVMKALDAWDYLQKPVSEHDFIQTLLGVLEQVQAQKSASASFLTIDPLLSAKPTWKGKRVNIPATAQRILHAIYDRRGQPDPTVTYEELFKVVASGKTKENIRKQISVIKGAIREHDPEFDGIIAEPMKGYRWVNR